MTVAIDEAVMRLSSALLGVRPEDLDRTIHDHLGRLAPIVGADRAYVLKVGGSAVQVFDEWWAEGVEQRRTPIDQLPQDAQRFWFHHIVRGEVVTIDDVAEAEGVPDAALAGLRADGVAAIAFIPLVAAGSPVGFFGLESRTDPVGWEPATVDRLRMVGELLVSAIDRCAADTELAQRNRELERSNRELEQFAAVISHDMKQPLLVCEGFLEIVGDVALSHPQRGAEAAGPLDAARRGLRRMRGLIDDVFALASARSVAEPPEPVALDAVVADVLIDLQHEIATTGAEVKVDPLPVIEGRPAQLRQLFQNLIANALKFHRPQHPPAIEVTVRPGTGASWQVRVADDGIGIDPAHRVDVFEMFARKRSDVPGFGIGLAVCARVAGAHGGRIWAEGNDLGGTTMVVELPMSAGGGA